MGYTTDFEGSFTCTPALNADQIAYLKAFAETRRMKRNPTIAEQYEDILRVRLDLPIGIEGEYFVGGFGSFGQDDDRSVIDHNSPASTQPGLWCQWTPNEDGTEIEWDGGEKFYSYIDWIKYINDNFLKKWGIVLNGKVEWEGEDSDDIGAIIAHEGEIRSHEGDCLEIGFEHCE